MSTATLDLDLAGTARAARWHRGLADLYAENGNHKLAQERAAVARQFETKLAGAGRCQHCGKALTDEESVAAGMGPDCRRLHGPRRT